MTTTKLAPFQVTYNQSEEFHGLKSEIFSYGVYYFESANPRPRIIDAGAHIGLSTLYFKKIFPEAIITAIEPNRDVLPLLRQNIDQNGLRDVTIAPVALSSSAGFANFYYDRTQDQWYSTASFHEGAWNNDQRTAMKTVETETLDHFLDQPVDFLKLDIEGAEQKVLEASQKIRQIQKMMIEFHPHPSQSLPKLLEWLKQHDFEIQLWKDGKDVSEQRAKGMLYIEATQRQKR